MESNCLKTVKRGGFGGDICPNSSHRSYCFHFLRKDIILVDVFRY